MQRRRAFVATCGLAVLVGLALWFQGDEDTRSVVADGESPRNTAPSGATIPRRAWSEPGRASPKESVTKAPTSAPRRRFGERPAGGEDDPEVSKRRAFGDAVHTWRIESQKRILDCLPGIEMGRPSELRVVFEPLPQRPEWLPPRLVVSLVERAGIDPEDDAAPPFSPEVRGCLDLLLGGEVMLPEGAPELETRYEELLIVPLG